jgi:hypothetical protein
MDLREDGFQAELTLRETLPNFLTSLAFVGLVFFLSRVVSSRAVSQCATVYVNQWDKSAVDHDRDHCVLSKPGPSGG